VTIKPGRPFWSAFTAFAANMTALFGVDQLTITEGDIVVHNWWVALVVSAFVGAAVYGKEKISDSRKPETTEVQ
jgi:hypothetical protein